MTDHDIIKQAARILAEDAHGGPVAPILWHWHQARLLSDAGLLVRVPDEDDLELDKENS